jgi:hypothetical protein
MYKPHKIINRYITVTSGMRGYFAVMITDEDGFEQPDRTSPFSSQDKDEAIEDAKEWAKSECLSFKE